MSEEKLAGTTGGVAGQPNLYVDDGSSTTFIAVLSRTDVYRTEGTPIYQASDVDPWPVNHAALASPNGTKLAFTSTRRLTSYDNTDVEMRPRRATRIVTPRLTSTKRAPGARYAFLVARPAPRPKGG